LVCLQLAEEEHVAPFYEAGDPSKRAAEFAHMTFRLATDGVADMPPFDRQHDGAAAALALRAKHCRLERGAARPV
jgi:hypothetical protein